MKPPNRHLCPKFQRAMALLSRPWNGLIIATLEQGPARFSELGVALETLGDRMLALRLRELESLGVVERTVQPGPPVRVEYQLTALGRGFRLVEDAIQRWGESFADAPTPPLAAPRKATRARTGRSAPRAKAARA